MNEVLLETIKKSSKLPSLPGVAIRVLELSRRSDVSMNEMAKIVSGDPALSAKILKTVNSSFYGMSKQVSTISQAMILLGLQSVKTLALGFSLSAGLNSDKSPDFDYLQFWKQSLNAAVAARALAKRVEPGLLEEAFLAAMFSDIGTLVMHQVIGAEYDELLKACAGDQVALIRLSREKFDLDHALVGGMLAEHWKLPPVLVEPIRLHHSLAEVTASSGKLVKVVFGAVICGQLFAANLPGMLEGAQRELRTLFDLPDEKIEAIFNEIGEKTRQLADLFEVDIGPKRSYSEIQDEARQALMELTLETQMQSQQIQQQNSKLQMQATTDTLTGLTNRAGFAEYIEEAFAESLRTGRPLSVLFMDVDKFKSINDTRGHQAGDEVLAALGKLLRSKVQTPHLAARYGGEEMVIALKGMDSLAAAHVAESIRNAIESEKIAFSGKLIPVTASIGVSGTDGHTLFKSADQLIQAADKAVYAAKESGRNNVKRFVPTRAGAKPTISG